MNTWILFNLKYLSGRSILSDKVGQTQIRPKYIKTFLNTETGEFNSVTDLESKKYKRDRILSLFYQVYKKHYLDKTLTILSCVANQDTYPTISKFMNTITRKLKRKEIERLGYVWVRDIGDIKFDKHYHIIIATTYINKNKFKELFCKKDHSNYEIELLKKPTGMLNYIKDKELYGANKQRTYGKSRKFPLKKRNLKQINIH